MRISDWSSECALPISPRPALRQGAPGSLWGISADAAVTVGDRPVAPRARRYRLLAGAGAAHHRPRRLWQGGAANLLRSEEHTSELQSLMRISYAVFCLKNTRLKTTQHIILNKI